MNQLNDPYQMFVEIDPEDLRKGYVKNFFDDGQFGFIKPRPGTKDIHFHKNRGRILEVTRDRKIRIIDTKPRRSANQDDELVFIRSTGPKGDPQVAIWAFASDVYPLLEQIKPVAEDEVEISVTVESKTRRPKYGILTILYDHDVEVGQYIEWQGEDIETIPSDIWRKEIDDIRQSVTWDSDEGRKKVVFKKVLVEFRRVKQ